MNIKKLSQIWIYPIKSLAGISLQKSTVLPKGLQFDRRWMLVDENGRFLTQREHPEMALFKVAIEKNFLLVSRSDTIRLELNKEIKGESFKVQIWKNEVLAIEVNPNYSKWFSDQLNFKCKLVFFPEINQREIDPEYAKMNEQVSLADAYPYLIIGQSSLDNLNNKLDLPIQMNRFRPNFVFTSGLANEEDSWKNFKIGAILFEGVKPCARCVLTTVNTDTGEKGLEPLKTLAVYRKQNGKVNFGENVIARSHGEVKIGDLIEVSDFK
jgi:uncharacterized protein YcbX